MLFAQNFEQKLYSQSAEGLTHVSVSRPLFVCFMSTKKGKAWVLKQALHGKAEEKVSHIVVTSEEAIKLKGLLVNSHVSFNELKYRF